VQKGIALMSQIVEQFSELRDVHLGVLDVVLER
jgi:hypothetical protein